MLAVFEFAKQAQAAIFRSPGVSQVINGQLSKQIGLLFAE